MKTIDEIIKMLKKDIEKLKSCRIDPNSPNYQEQKVLLERKILAKESDIADWESVIGDIDAQSRSGVDGVDTASVEPLL